MDLFASTKTSASTLNVYTCETCHRRTEGERPDLILPGATLAGAARRPHYWGGKEPALLKSINDCRFFFMGSRKEWTASDADAVHVYAALTDLDKRATPALREPQPFTVVTSFGDLSGGDATRGAVLYRRACGYCHGAAAGGQEPTGLGRITDRAPLLPDDTIASHLSYVPRDQMRLVFIEKVRHGSFLGYSGIMPPFSREVLSDTDLRDILAYLRL
jgi:thiosulfate dehydrogenase